MFDRILRRSRRIAATFAVCAVAAAAHADYPERPVTWVVPFPPGGPTDVASRVLAQAFQQELGESFVALNKAGASGAIGVRQIVQSKPDGYTVGVLAGPSLLAPLMQASRPYDLTTDVQPIGTAYVTPLVLAVNPEALPDVTDVASLVQAARRKDINFTSPATGSIGHLSMELLKTELDFPALHIGYQGSSPAVTAVLSGDVSVILADGLTLLPHIRAGSLRAIAVNGDGFEALPELRTLSDQGVQSTHTISWGGIVAPAGLPAEITERLSTALQAVLKDPKVAERMRAAGAYPSYEDPEATARRIAEDSATWQKVIDDNELRQHQ